MHEIEWRIKEGKPGHWFAFCNDVFIGRLSGPSSWGGYYTYVISHLGTGEPNNRFSDNLKMNRAEAKVRFEQEYAKYISFLKSNLEQIGG